MTLVPDVARPRRIVVAPDSFKGTITAADAAEALGEGWASVDPDAEILRRPMADGGEGTVAAFRTAVPGARDVTIDVDGPAGKRIAATWLLLPSTADAPHGTAVIDIASTSGIELLDELRPWDADTTGFGQAIVDALDRGVSRLLLGIGSSASTDGGTGMLRALGMRFLGENEDPVAPGARGIADIVTIDRRAARALPETLVLTDVTNPLTGPRGAAAVFGPQKGLIDGQDIAAVDRALGALATLLGLDPDAPGAGAAGGAGAALLAIGARLAPGAGEIASLIDLPAALAAADIVLTGEGSYDGQSGDGKVPSFVAGLAVAAGAHPLLIAGRITTDADVTLFQTALSLTDLAGSVESARAEPARWLRYAGAALARRAAPQA